MDFKVINKTSRTISLELSNSTCFFSKNEYEIYINEIFYQTNNKNIVTIMDLKPNNIYEIYIKDVITKCESPIYEVKTEHESITFNVRDFGAKGDGETLDTCFIQSAISSCPKDARILIPKGEYLVTSIFLKSDITIELEEGAVLKGSTNRKHYPILPGIMKDNKGEEFYLGSWEGDPQDCFASMFTGVNVENVNIIGSGEIDGQASYENWWNEAKKKKIAWRPRMVFLVNSRNILMEGIKVKNSPSWNIHPMFSENLRCINLSLSSVKDSPNTDGINPESCKDVLIAGVNFSVGDDCIAIKSGKMYLGKKLGISSENITIRNCNMEFGHGAIVIGSEMSGGIKNVEATKCIFHKTDRGIRIKTRRGRGENGVIKGIKAENIIMKNVLTPFVINCFYFCDEDGKSEYVWSKDKYPVDENTPSIKNIYYKDIVCEDTEVSAGFFYGLPEKKIENIHLENISVSFKEDSNEDYPAMMSFLDKTKKSGLFVGNADRVYIKDFSINGEIGEKFVFTEVDNLNM